MSVKIHLRLARADDAGEYYDLVNDLSVRENSFTKNIIEWDSHLRWFIDKLMTEETILFVLENEAKDFLGQIRFDYDSKSINCWYIDYSVVPKARGKGYGTLIVKLGVEKLLDAKADATICAEVKNENTASLKVFRKLGYVETKQKNSSKFHWQKIIKKGVERDKPK